ncbi:MAG TPA: alpha/beta hydrolase [Desulfobacteraceae bacterium]|nr:alpha/beta hydrolase [Desulfobacteraceae bacterium]
MGETPVRIAGKDVVLEGRERMVAGSTKGVVVTHPHPLYGGNMDNQVVRQIADTFYKNGFSTLRFNFRGTGEGTGNFDDGAGEQDDVHAALDYFRGRNITALFLAGYSFGAWVNAHAVDAGASVDGHIMVSPPVNFLAFDDVQDLSRTGLIVTGEYDDIAPADQIRHMIELSDANPDLRVLAGCDHFYAAGALDRLGQCIHTYLNL